MENIFSFWFSLFGLENSSPVEEATSQFLSGLPLSGVVCVELFAGSARLTSSLGGEGFDSFGIDHVVSKQASGSIL